MNRNLSHLTQTEFDLAIIGGGIYGACVAWEAASRGLSVALLEMGDFGAATSANSLKTIHGGFRYLQHADFARVRESMIERRTLMHIAPHLVHPLPVLVPTYGHGLKGREALAAALLLNDALGSDRNQRAPFHRAADPQKRIPPGRSLSRRETLDRLPGLEPRGLTGAAVFYDAQVYNSERLVLAFLQAAAQSGAALANYARVDGFLRSGSKIRGVRVTDELSGDRFEVRARVVVNTAGPWVGQLLGLAQSGRPQRLPLARAVNLITRPLFGEYAVGLMGQKSYKSERFAGGKGPSLLFVAPWRGHAILGTHYYPHPGEAGEYAPEEREVQDLLAAFNAAYPAAELERSEITHVHAGLLPAAEVAAADGAVRLLNHYRIDDHRKDGLQGLLSVVGVKYTTARDVAVKAVDRAFELLGWAPAPTVSFSVPLPGGRIERFADFLAGVTARRPCGLEPELVRGLVYNYGSAYEDVLKLVELRPEAGVETSGSGETSERASEARSETHRSLDDGDSGFDAVLRTELNPRKASLLAAQIRYAVREEMALKLTDVILRRTDLGTAGHPGDAALRLAAGVMAAELGWSPQRQQQEIEEVACKYTTAP